MSAAIKSRRGILAKKSVIQGDRVLVRVTCGSANNIARAGIGIRAKNASSTNSDSYAAIAAAAKYFDCPESHVTMRRVRSGDDCKRIKAIYLAVKLVEGGAK